MRTSFFSALLLPTLSACHVVNSQAQPAGTPASIIAPTATAAFLSLLAVKDAPAPAATPSPAQENLEIRDISASSASPTDSDSLTVEWVETVTSGRTTWVPVTVTFVFAGVPDQLAQPGKGEIGLGTIATTKTAAAGAAPTRGVEWMGVAAAVGVGVVGMVV